MSELSFFVYLAFFSAIAIYFFWFICQFNGKVILYLIKSIFSRQKPSALQIKQEQSVNFYPITVYLLGATPLAILSLGTAGLNTCFNSFQTTFILEILFLFSSFFIPSIIRKEWDLLGIKTIKNNTNIIIYVGLWCLSFALWATINHQESLDYMISNTNPDMWAYVRRFGGFSTANLNFYGGLDSFTFDDHSACAYLLGSPKKFSSFLGSLIVYLLGGSALGIAVFQGMLGGILFLCLFREWFDVNLESKKHFSLGKLTLITWALFSPQIYWLMVSAYFSNALFLIIVCLTLRQGKYISLNSSVDASENLITFLAILIIVFAFYPAFLPVIIFVYALVTLVYLPSNYFQIPIITKIAVKYLAIITACGLIFYFFFSAQLGLYEIQKSLNVLTRHGSNFVPLNPWSLLQEKPKPMALQRDFGWYINIIISLPLSLFVARKLWQKYQQTQESLTRHHLLAGLVGVGIYSGYLIAFIPLEHTYRLMKIAISLVYPLAIFGLLPFILWLKQQINHKSPWVRNSLFILAIAHVILHIHKTFDLNPYPAGNFTLVNPERLQNLDNITLLACPDIHQSQFYERLVGLQIARTYPDLEVNVVKFPELLAEISQKDLVIYGETVVEPETNKKTCNFSIR